MKKIDATKIGGYQTLMKVGPAASMRETRRPYHQTAPHLSPLRARWGLPTSSMGLARKTGANRNNRYTKRLAVKMGSHNLSRKRRWTAAATVRSASNGEKMVVGRGGQGISEAEERAARAGEGAGARRKRPRPAEMGRARKT